MAGPSRDKKLSYIAKDTSEVQIASIFHIFKLLIFTFIIAVISWGFTTLLRYGIEHGSERMIELASGEISEWYMFFAIIFLAACVRAILITHTNWTDAHGDGATESMQKFYDSYDEPNNDKRYQTSTFTQAIRRLIMTFLTLGTGGSGGLEGPAIPIGEGVGAGFGKYFKINQPNELRALQLAGISACVCTLLQSPLTSVIFAAEVVFCGRFIYRPMMYGLIGSLVAFFMNNHFSTMKALYELPTHASSYSLLEYLEISLVAVVVSIPMGIGLKKLLALFRSYFSHIPMIMRSPLAAILVTGIAYFFINHLEVPPSAVIGIGEDLMKDLINNEAIETSFQILFAIILGKTLVTALTLMAGGSAGLLIPATFLGSFCGALMYKAAVVYQLTSISSPTLYIVTGLVSSLVTVIEIPLTAIVFIIEVFGRNFGPSAILGVCICHFFIDQLKLYRVKKGK